jgi:pyruvate formate lyase activating enzyme
MEKIAETTGKIFKIKRFSVHDGAGIRTSVFLKGCPLNCIWCHSPEGIDSEIRIWHDKSLCIGCWECVKSCPSKALERSRDSESKINIRKEKCKLKGECVKACPSEAIQFTGTLLSVSDILTEIEKDILYYNTSGGGVTLTGGEPLYQPEFSSEILRGCRLLKIHTVIETCLFCDHDIVSNVLNLVDLFIVDIKIFDQKQHINYTGQSNSIIKDNLRYLSESGKNIIVRIPMIPGVTDNEMNMNNIEKYVNDLDPQIPVEHIKYNPLAENNYKKLGIPFLLKI